MTTGLKHAIIFSLAVLFTLSASHAWAALEPSNSVKSSELITDFALIKDASDPEVTSILNLFKVGKENRGPSLLETSPDDVITLKVADHIVTCLPNKECRLPYLPGELYKAELKRGNGESFSTTTMLPKETRITTPNDNSMFNQNDPVDFSWVVARAEGPRGITLSVFLNEQISTCSTSGNIDWLTEGTAKAPANYVSTCVPPLRARFGVFYVNLSPMPGVAGGTLKGYSTARVFYTYMPDGIRVERTQRPLEREEFLEMIGERQNPTAVTKTLIH